MSEEEVDLGPFDPVEDSDDVTGESEGQEDTEGERGSTTTNSSTEADEPQVEDSNSDEQREKERTAPSVDSERTTTGGQEGEVTEKDRIDRTESERSTDETDTVEVSDEKAVSEESAEDPESHNTTTADSSTASAEYDGEDGTVDDETSSLIEPALEEVPYNEPQPAESYARFLEDYVQQINERLEEKNQVIANLRERIDQEVEKQVKNERKRMVTDLYMKVRDPLQRGLEGEDLREGVELTLDQFDAVMQEYDVEPIEPDIGDEVTHPEHEVFRMFEHEAPERTIIDVFENGYRIGEEVVKPARVVVSSGPAQEDEEAETAEKDTNTEDAVESETISSERSSVEDEDEDVQATAVEDNAALTESREQSTDSVSETDIEVESETESTSEKADTDTEGE